MRDAIAAILGEYTPLAGGGIAGIDYEYIVSAVVFCICLWFTFSFIRTFLCGVMNRRW